MKKGIYLLLFIIQSFAIQAQTIKGVVFSEKDKTPIEFAPMALLQLPDSVLVTSITSQTGGQFTFKNVKPGNYFIKATCLSCSPNGKSIQVTNEVKTIQVDTIFMSTASKQLNEVTVTGARIKSKELVDRTVYSIPPEIAKTSINGYEVLRKIPGIQVDFNNNVTLNGKSNFIIQVDGKLRDKEYLSRLQPSDIETVEVINNPSGKYEGTIDGVINIILKKEARYGISGNISGMIRTSDKPTGYGAGSLEYGLGKISFYASGYSFIQQLQNNTTNYYHYLFNDSISNFAGTGSFKISASAINSGFDYYINDKNNLSFNFSYKPTSLKNDIDNRGPIAGDSVSKYFLISPSNTNTHSNETNASLFYKKQYAKPIKELTAEVNFYTFKSKDDNSFSNNFYSDDQVTLLNSWGRLENNTNNRSYISAKTDFVQPIGFSARFETGYQFYYQQIDYDFISSDTMFNNQYKYSELRNSAYTGLTWNVKKIGFQTMLRAENSNVLINKDKSSNYLTLLPSANIQYKFNASHNLKFTYNRRINRPGVYDLNPFIRVNNNLSISAGNPNLKPEYRDKLQLTYTLNFGGNNFSPNIYYEIITHKIGSRITQAESPLTHNITSLSTPDNILTGYERGLGLNTMITFFKKITFNINGRLYQGHYDEYKDQFVSINARNYSSFSLTSYAFSQLPKKINAFAFINYNGVNVNAQSKTYSAPIYGLGAQKTAGNHTFGFVYVLPFSKVLVYNKIITETQNTYSKTTSSFDVSYFVQIMYSYKFNKGKAVKKVNRKVEVESDTKGGGVGR